MNYYYNLTLNYKWLQFYEWTFEDELIEIKKIPVFRISENTLINMCKYNGKVKKEFLSKIKNQTTYKKDGKISTILYSALFTDTKFCIATIFKKDGSIISRSFLLLEDELNVLEIGYSLKKEKIVFNKEDKINNDLLFKQEEKMKKIILNEIKNAYETNNKNKLIYYYLEWFKDNCNNIDTIYKRLIDKLNSDCIKELEIMYNLVLLVTK